MSDPVPVSSKPTGDSDEVNKSAKSPVAINALSVKMAGAIRPYLDKAAPALVMVTTAFGIAEPYVVALWAYLQYVWEKLQPYHPEELFPALAGFVLVFFGGNFFTLCAAVEAYRLVGFEDTKRAIGKLVASYKVARAASAKDDELDEDGDGIADVKQIGKKELVVRKLGVVAKAVDPELVADALTAINTGLMAVVATLRVKFAQCVTLGVTVGGIAHNIVSTHFEPVLLELTPPDYKKWVAPTVRHGCKLAGVTLAWSLQMTISAFHSSSRGAQLFARGTLSYLVRRGYLKSSAVDETGKFFNLCIVAFGLVGFWSQFWSGFSLPFPLNILLLPVRFAEWGLRVLVFMLG